MWHYGVGGGQRLLEAKVEEQVRTETDRGAGLVAGAIAEFWTELALKHQMPNKDDAVQNFLFNPSGPLGPFRCKIDLLFALGCLSADAHKDLVNVKDIRNKFAHSLDAHSFNDQSISAKCANFVLCDRLVGDISPEESDAYMEALKRGEKPPVSAEDAKYWVRYTGASKALKIARNRYVTTVQLFGIFLDMGVSGSREKPYI